MLQVSYLCWIYRWKQPRSVTRTTGMVQGGQENASWQGVITGWTWPPACKPSNITFQRAVVFEGPSSAPVHRKVWAKKAGAPGGWRNDPPSSWATAVKTIQQPHRCPGVTAQQAQSPTLVLQPLTPQDSLSMPLFACSLLPIQLSACPDSTALLRASCAHSTFWQGPPELRYDSCEGKDLF